MTGTCAMVRLPVATMTTIAEIIKNFLSVYGKSDPITPFVLKTRYELSVWCDILEGTARLHSEGEREMASSKYGGL